MEHEFKKGDKVRFICKPANVFGTLTVGKIYEVIRVGSDNVNLINDKGHESSYMHYRFELFVDNSLQAQIEKAKSL